MKIGYARVSTLDISLHNTPGQWLNEIDVVISCVPGSQSLPVAKEIIPFLKKSSLFSDFSSASPQDKKLAAKVGRNHYVDYADVVIMGGVDLTKEKTPLLCASTHPEKIIEIMKKFGTPMRILPSAKPGDAASLKLLRTVFMKGLSALTVECMTAAKHQGVKSLLYEILSDFDKTPLSEFLDMLIKNHVMHACRQVHEIHDANKQLNQIGFETQVMPAVEKLFQKTCDHAQLQKLKHENLTTEDSLKWLIETRKRKII